MGKNEIANFHVLHINNHKDHTATQQTNKEFRWWLLYSLVLCTISHSDIGMPCEAHSQDRSQTDSLLCTIPHAMLT
jgi:hypothetical protein